MYSVATSRVKFSSSGRVHWTISASLSINLLIQPIFLVHTDISCATLDQKGIDLSNISLFILKLM